MIPATTGPAAGRTPRRPGRAARLTAAVLAAVAVAVLGTATPAHAHGGPIRLEVSGDGMDRVITTVTWKKDGHPVSDPVELTLVAAPASGGPQVGPIRMTSSPEGQSFYIAERPLTKGAWRVTVTATAPSKASMTKTITMNGPMSHSMKHHHSAQADTGDRGASVFVPVAGLIAVIAITGALFIGWAQRRRHG
ncbi:hypothetical protein GCM10009780_64560 [Actinomadura alba]